MTPPPSPAGGCTFRPARVDDAEAMFAAMASSYAVDRPRERETLEDVRWLFDTPWWDPAADSLVAVDGSGQVRGHAQVMVRPGAVRTLQAVLMGVVEPGTRGVGVGSALLAWQVDRAREALAAAARDGLPRFLRAFCEEHLDDRARLLAAAGFQVRRYNVSMSRDLAVPSPVAHLPSGLSMVPTPAEDHDLQERIRLAHAAAFTGHWGSEPVEADDWRRRVVAGPGSRPDLGRAVLDDAGEVVGYLVSGTYPEDWAAQGWTEGWTMLLGVAASWRGRGVGRALLLEAIAAYRAEGLQRAGLGVDVENPRALGLYASLGYEVRGREASWVLDA